MPPRTPRGPARVRRSGVLLVIVLLAGLSLWSVPVEGANTSAAEPTLVVTLSDDGSADVTLRTTVDLADEADRAALERLERNRSELAAGFRDRLAGIARRTAATTGREMRVTNATARITTDGATGAVELSATWIGLAAVAGDRLVVSAPFDSGFDPAGRFVLRGPDGYVIESASPTPDERTTAAATWGHDASLDGFEVTFAPANGAAGDGSSRSLPGFDFRAGAIAALAAAAAAGIAGRRWS